MTSPRDPLIGRMLGPYTILEQIGHGGMSRVYRGFHEPLNRTVAVKVLPAMLANDPTTVARFRREAAVVGRLAHQNILPVFDTGEQDGLLYLVMQHVAGGTLRERLEQGPMDLGLTAVLIGQLADALAYAHAQGVVHRDVKPSNVLMARPDWCLLADFGIARVAEESGLTATGAGIGTPEYMSPEQGQGLPIDSRSDIYSLGVILYEMLTGRVPFAGTTALGIIHKHVYEPLSAPSRLRPEISPLVEAVVMKALEKQPERRFQSATDLKQALLRALGNLTTSATAVNPAPVVRPAIPAQPPAPRATATGAAISLSTPEATAVWPQASASGSGPVVVSQQAVKRPAGGLGRLLVGTAAGLGGIGAMGVCLLVVVMAGRPSGLGTTFGLAAATQTAIPGPVFTPRPTATPTATPVPAGGTLFQAQFQNAAEWETDPDHELYLESSALHVISRKPNSAFFSRPINVQTAENLVVEAAIIRVSGPTAGFSGIFVRDGATGFYLFSIDGTGRFSFDRYVRSVLGNSRYEALVPSTPSRAIVSALNASNTLKIEANGTKIRLFINDQLVHELEDASIRTQGTFGVMSGTQDLHIAVTRFKATRI